ncbi:hypothetical protein PFLUV_G00054690 [Perca fluviatilis]|uniref:Uncharacterized protein n=1 Tax=Perca fluviatilis TaxID=8168 RepID=A0A6A5FCH1_PERFL|nr:hypothetical protein PFLUV_G00054690 [Perca fluviatilis]
MTTWIIGCQLCTVNGIYCSVFLPTQIWINLVEKREETPKSFPKWWRTDLNLIRPTLLPVVSLVGIFSNKKNCGKVATLGALI